MQLDLRKTELALQTSYGAQAARYRQDDEIDIGTAHHQRLADTLAQITSSFPRPIFVLDVGCGTGLVGRALRSRGFAGRLAGLDISEASYTVARQSGAYDALEPADLQQRLAVEDDSVDVVVCVGVMTYLPDVEAVWRELAWVVRRGGVVVVTQREDLWDARGCQEVVDRLEDEGVWTPVDITGPAPYLPEGYGGTPPVGCYYLTARMS